MGLRCLGLAVLALAACSRVEGHNAVSNQAALMVPPPGTGPDARTPLAPARSAIDPKSPEAAKQLVERYGELVEQGRWAEAGKLWTSPQSASRFAADFSDQTITGVRVENPDRLEGAAGSIYVTVDVGFYGKLKSGAKAGGPAVVTLRRVNEVPGSTEAQRRWHIERIDWQPL